MSLLAQLAWSLKYSRITTAVIADYLDSIQGYLTVPLASVPLVAIDMEMTGLDCKTDEIVSVGIQPFTLASIKLSHADYQQCNIGVSVGESAIIHGIVDQQLCDGINHQELLTWLFSRIHGQVIVAHCAPLDMGFLKQLLQQQYGRSCRLPAIDTMAVERRLHRQQQGQFNPLDYRLAACRQRYNLPIYSEHHALTDALACAELLLAQSQTTSANALYHWL